jgi:hypothetical protein
MTSESESQKQTLSDIAKLDVSKLHSEITQITSQRFQLTVAAIVLFSTASGWIASRISMRTSEALNLASAACIFVVFALTILYVYYFMLLRMMRIFTTYIKLKYMSQWEADWQDYRRNSASKTYTGYSIAGLLVFLGLGVLSWVYPHLLVFLSPVPPGTQPPDAQSAPLMGVSLVVTVVYLILVALTAIYRNSIHNETKIEKDWQQVLAKNKGR